MCTDEFYKYPSFFIVNCGDQSIIVLINLKHNPVIFKSPGCIKILSDVSWLSPPFRTDILIPLFKRLLAVRVLTMKLDNRTLIVYIHETDLFSQIYKKK